MYTQITLWNKLRQSNKACEGLQNEIDYKGSLKIYDFYSIVGHLGTTYRKSIFTFTIHTVASDKVIPSLQPLPDEDQLVQNFCNNLYSSINTRYWILLWALLLLVLFPTCKL